MNAREPSQPFRPNPLLERLYGTFFEHLRADDEWLANVRAMAERGSVVHVLRSLSFIDFLALDHLTKKHGLPELRFANDFGLWVLEPMGKRRLGGLLPLRRPTPDDALRSALSSGGSAALFLKRPPNALELVATRNTRSRGRADGEESIRALVRLQRSTDRPIFLCPQLFIWSRAPDKLDTDLVDYVLGPREWPGKVRSVIDFLRNYRSVVLRGAEPLELRAYLGKVGAERPPARDDDDDLTARRVTSALVRRVERERRAALGPARKSNDRMRDEVIRSTKLRETVRELAGEGEREQLLLTAKAYAMIRELEAAPDPEVIGGFDKALDVIVHRIYDGVELDAEGLDRVRDAARRGTVVLLPSHKSHVDYLIISYVFLKEGLQLPLIAAGDNLAFFPMGGLFRRAGAFFIRRSFKGDKLYSAVVQAYIRRLVMDGWAMEFFIEGGRSRTGKLLAPKLGLLSMVVEAGLSLEGRELFFVPVSIGYERIVESRSYVHELTGGEKQKEDAAGLLRSTNVLRGRYGRLNIQFGDILPLHHTAHAGAVVGSPSDEQKRALVARLAHRVMAEINRVTAVTPGSVVALALLTHPKPYVPHKELAAACERLTKLLVRMGARTSKALVLPDGRMRHEAIREAAQLFLDADLVRVHAPDDPAGEGAKRRSKVEVGGDAVYEVPNDKRLSLDLSKNIILHFFVSRALVATAMRGHEAGPVEVGAAFPLGERSVPRAALAERVRRLSRLFKFEFMFRADATFDEIFDDTLAEMQADAELVRRGDDVAYGEGHDGLGGRAWIDFYASLARTFLDAYRVAARATASLVKGPASRKEIAKRALPIGRRMFLEGEILHPEAVCRPIVENALLAFVDQGYVLESEGKLRLPESLATPEAARTIEARIARYVVDDPRREA